MDQIGKYMLQGELGRGGFGTVYRGWDPEMRRSVAIKVINLHVGNDPATLARFRSEAATTANLHHRNIVTIYDSGEHEGKPWFAMEFLDGKTLRRTLEEKPGLELWEKVNTLLQVAEGLQYAHDRGVVHRDIKPANVMLLEGGGVKVLDFGIARVTDPEMTRHATATGMVQGTFGYLAPEQLEGSRGDPVSDIFSFGVVCYEALTGVQPFQANSLVHAVNLIANFNPEPVGKFVPDCPKELQEIVQKALAKDPTRRYRSLQDLILDLAPVEVSLRRARATELAGEAEGFLKKGDARAAHAQLDRALGLDRLNAKGQALRSRMPELPQTPADDATQTIQQRIEPAPAPRRSRALVASAVVALALLAVGLGYFKTRPEPAAHPASASSAVTAPRPTSAVAEPTPAPAPKVVPAPGEVPGPTAAIQSAIRSGDWADAASRVKQFDKENPGDPRVADWQDQIKSGSAKDRKLAGLRVSIAEAMSDGAWGKADNQIRKLLQESPHDPEALRWRQEVEAGISDDHDGALRRNQIKSLRAAFKADLKAKRWSAAQRDIDNLQAVTPRNPEVKKWRDDLAKQRP